MFCFFGGWFWGCLFFDVFWGFWFRAFGGYFFLLHSERLVNDAKEVHPMVPKPKTIVVENKELNKSVSSFLND